MNDKLYFQFPLVILELSYLIILIYLIFLNKYYKNFQQEEMNKYFKDVKFNLLNKMLLI